MMMMMMMMQKNDYNILFPFLDLILHQPFPKINHLEVT